MICTSTVCIIVYPSIPDNDPEATPGHSSAETLSKTKQPKNKIRVPAGFTEQGPMHQLHVIPTKHMPTSQPSAVPHRTTRYHPTTRTHTDGATPPHSGGMKPKIWDSTSYTSVQRIHPIDNVARRARLLFPKWSVPRKPNIWSRPDPDECEYYNNTLKQVHEYIYRNWKLLNRPEYYSYRPMFRTCWHFITVNKFTASCLYQMRAGKSYLKAQKDRRNPEVSVLCPRCENEPETFLHLIAHCWALTNARAWTICEDF